MNSYISLLKRALPLVLVLGVTLAWSGVSQAHFGVIMPSDDMVESGESRQVDLSFEFMHPFEQKFMELSRPLEAGVMVRGQRTDLLPRLTEGGKGGHTTWKASYTMTRPGDHIFFMVPQPYWEPAEDSYIQHFTKVVVNGFGLEDGWDQPVGLRTEIVPTTRPYGLWTGNLFCGQVLLDGRPASDSEIEVEYYNQGEEIHAPAAPYITQVLKADETGRFCYAMPIEGWWGFAALNQAPEGMTRDGRRVELELGAVIWVRTRGMGQ